MFLNNKFDVIVVGGGHAGVEASYVSSKMNCNTLLITFNINKIAEMSCNPSIGGLGKSNLVKEIDALGGLMGKLADISGINFKILNSSKGYAVQATRIQVDKYIYKKNVFKYLNNMKFLTILQSEVIDLLIKDNIVYGVKLNKFNIYSKFVILCVGTFLDSKIYIGNNMFYGGRLFDFCSLSLASNLKKYFCDYGYLKTGTPPRILSKTVNLSTLDKEKSDLKIVSKFSYFNKLNKIKSLPQLDCYITKTNQLTHFIIKKNLIYSPLYNGLVSSKGPRYCPSIEDKVNYFNNRNSHNIFLEPESLKLDVLYPSGISTSLPIKFQKKFLNTIKGMEKSEIIYPGYCVEYMYLNPINLNKTLESKLIENLFIAGQINGTTGYEEAASQGLIAGLNVGIKNNFKVYKPYIPSRYNSYIGVLIDDICTKGISEPYRIFNSRAEFNLFLREDNADYRLSDIAIKYGLISGDEKKFFVNKINEIKKIYSFLDNKIYFLQKFPKNIINKFSSKKKYIKIKSIICNPLIKFKDIKKIIFSNKKEFFKSNFLREVKILFLYEGYLKKQKIEFSKFKYYDKIILPKGLVYNKIPGLSNEVIYLLNLHKPNFLGQLLRISGITPYSIIVILVYLKKNNFISY